MSYQASYFGDVEEIRPSVETIPLLMNAFVDHNFLPNTFTFFEGTFDGSFPVLPKPQARLRLSSEDSEWNIQFETDRVRIQKAGVSPYGSNMGEPEKFTHDAIDFLERILKHFPKKAHRLSLVISELLMDISNADLKRLYSEFIVPNEFYGQNPPSAWKSRTVSRIQYNCGDMQEDLNVITDVNRAQVNVFQDSGVEPVDGIQVTFDINTYQGRTDPRFELPHVKLFYPKALEIYDEVNSMLRERLQNIPNA